MTIKAVGKWKSGFASWLEDDRGHRVPVDLPRDEGGEDAGTSALELNILSLTGCITTIFALVAQKRRVRFEGMKVELEAERPRGAPTITAVKGRCVIVSTQPAEEVEHALRITLRTCPVGVLYEKAGIPVTVDCEVLPPGSAPADAALQAAPSPPDRTEA